MERVKRSAAAGVVEGKLNTQVEDSGFLGQWRYSVCYYNNRHMSLYMCPNPRDTHPHSGPEDEVQTLSD